MTREVGLEVGWFDLADDASVKCGLDKLKRASINWIDHTLLAACFSRERERERRRLRS